MSKALDHTDLALTYIVKPCLELPYTHYSDRYTISRGNRWMSRQVTSIGGVHMNSKNAKSKKKNFNHNFKNIGHSCIISSVWVAPSTHIQ